MKFRIKEYAHEQGVRLGEIAGKLRIPLSNLSAINSGSRSVSLRLLGRIAKLLNCRVADLMDEPEDSLAFGSPGLDRTITQIEDENPLGTDKAWVHRVMLARRGHYGRVIKEKESRYGKK
jgi:transcriptional regulator with XRE-family HTH domain